MKAGSAIAALAVLAAAGASAAGVAVVSQKGRAFSTGTVRIGKGDTVRFDNQDSFIHQIYVHAHGLDFESDEQEPGTSVSVRFPAVGTYDVRCQIHPKMLLTVDAR